MNRVQLIGNLGRDAESKPTEANGNRTTLSLATNHRWKDAQSGEWKERTDWHDVVACGKLADTASALKKGTSAFVEGELRSREYEKEGVKHRTYEVVASSIAPIAR